MGVSLPPLARILLRSPHCPTCNEVVLRFASRADRLLLDLRGAQLLVVPVPTPPDREQG
jgi:hypothetical protein